MVWYRIAKALRAIPILGIIIFLIYRHYCYLYGIDIALGAKIDLGFYIGHFSGIVVSPHASIGKNCNISQGVTIGVSGRADKRGAPTIGEGVYIGAGAKVLGKIHVGNNVAIGANAVVTQDVPDNAVVVGIPARVVSFEGAEEFIQNPYLSVVAHHSSPDISV